MWVLTLSRRAAAPPHCEWDALKAHVGTIAPVHLRALLTDGDRCAALTASTDDGVLLDYSRQKARTAAALHWAHSLDSVPRRCEEAIF